MLNRIRKTKKNKQQQRKNKILPITMFLWSRPHKLLRAKKRLKKRRANL